MNLTNFFSNQKKSIGIMGIISFLLNTIFAIVFYHLTFWKIISFFIVGVICFICGIFSFQDISTTKKTSETVK